MPALGPSVQVEPHGAGTGTGLVGSVCANGVPTYLWCVYIATKKYKKRGINARYIYTSIYI